MSSDDSTSQQPTSPVPTRRRSSFTTNRLSEMFSSARNPTSSSGSPPNSPPSQSSPSFNQNVFGSNAQANAQANGRRMSISTLGLSGTNNMGPSSGPYSASGSSNMWGFRRGSVSTGPPSNASSDDSAIDDSADGATVNASGPSPSARRGSGNAGNPSNSPLGRRMSFGARAMGQMRNESQGFNWADNLRNRQHRSSSAVGSGLMSPTRGSMSDNLAQPPSQAPAPKEPAPLPKREVPVKRPDHFQERILKGDFYMD